MYNALYASGENTHYSRCYVGITREILKKQGRTDQVRENGPLKPTSSEEVGESKAAAPGGQCLERNSAQR